MTGFFGAMFLNQSMGAEGDWEIQMLWRKPPFGGEICPSVIFHWQDTTFNIGLSLSIYVA